MSENGREEQSSLSILCSEVITPPIWPLCHGGTIDLPLALVSQFHSVIVFYDLALPAFVLRYP